jgi:cold shock CspA family protein
MGDFIVRIIGADAVDPQTQLVAELGRKCIDYSGIREHRSPDRTHPGKQFVIITIIVQNETHAIRVREIAKGLFPSATVEFKPHKWNNPTLVAAVSAPAEIPTERQWGWLSKWFAESGYGFITYGERRQEIFVHIANIVFASEIPFESHKVLNLKNNTIPVSFNMAANPESKSGKLQAVNIRDKDGNPLVLDTVFRIIGSVIGAQLGSSRTATIITGSPATAIQEAAVAALPDLPVATSDREKIQEAEVAAALPEATLDREKIPEAAVASTAAKPTSFFSFPGDDGGLEHHYMEMSEKVILMAIAVCETEEKKFLPKSIIGSLHAAYKSAVAWKTAIGPEESSKQLHDVLFNARIIIENILSQLMKGYDVNQSVEAMINHIESLAKAMMINGVVPSAETIVTLPNNISVIRDPIGICQLMRTVKTFGNVVAHQSVLNRELRVVGESPLKILPSTVFQTVSSLMTILRNIQITGSEPDLAMIRRTEEEKKARRKANKKSSSSSSSSSYM